VSRISVNLASSSTVLSKSLHASGRSTCSASWSFDFDAGRVLAVELDSRISDDRIRDRCLVALIALAFGFGLLCGTFDVVGLRRFSMSATHEFELTYQGFEHALLLFFHL
jgi:hypothetical protein